MENNLFKTRLTIDINNLDLPEEMKINFEKINDDKCIIKLNYEVGDHSYWINKIFNFEIFFPKEYPIKPPKVKCNEKIFHPNIDEDGNVCINILRLDWTPIWGLNDIIFGIKTIFWNPEPDEPYNVEASNLLKNNLEEFKNRIKQL